MPYARGGADPYPCEFGSYGDAGGAGAGRQDTGFFFKLCTIVMNRTIFITGATSGFGQACARKFAAGGDHLILTGRRKDRLDALKQELENQAGIQVMPLVFDVQDRSAVFAAVAALPEAWRRVD